MSSKQGLRPKPAVMTLRSPTPAALEGGAWKSHGFQALLDVPPVQDTIHPVVTPRPGHLALVLAAGVADGAVIDTSEYG